MLCLLTTRGTQQSNADNVKIPICPLNTWINVLVDALLAILPTKINIAFAVKIIPSPSIINAFLWQHVLSKWAGIRIQIVAYHVLLGALPVTKGLAPPARVATFIIYLLYC
jgi:hypothetical protein